MWPKLASVHETQRYEEMQRNRNAGGNVALISCAAEQKDFSLSGEEGGCGFERPLPLYSAS